VKKTAPLLAALATVMVALAGAALLAGPHPRLAGALVLVGTLGGGLVEMVLWRRPVIWTALHRLQVDASLRAGLRDLLLLAVAGGASATHPDLLKATGPVLVIVWGVRILTILLQRHNIERRDIPVSWRNLDVPGVRRSEPIGPGALSDAATWPSSGSLPLALGVAAHALGASTTYLWLGAAVSVCASLAVCLVAVADTLRATRESDMEETIDALAAAVAAYAPEVVLYYSRPEPIGYIANVWMHTLEQLPRRTAVIVREPHNAPLVATDLLPVIQITRPVDIERIIPPSVALAMYPSNFANNNHHHRLTEIFDVFVGHGDSDKGGSATVLTRIFDEAWVSGPAARDRYRVADVGVRDEQIREVGRPQLAEIERHVGEVGESHAGTDGVSSWTYTVLYAPTREGFFASWEYSSVLSQGAAILSTLLAMPGVRVLFKPHPGTGTDDPAFGEEVDRLLDLVARAGAPHEIVSGSEGLYHAFNRADMLVSDISSVITDFLASGKPYVVTNSAAVSDTAFRAEFPSAAGAYILAGDGTDVERYVRDAQETDSLRQARARTTAYLLGDTSRPPLERFKEAVETVLTSQRSATARRSAPRTPA
jgi:hypothetical protein